MTVFTDEISMAVLYLEFDWEVNRHLCFRDWNDILYCESWGLILILNS